MTQHTQSSNNRNASNPSNTNTGVLYSHKTRGTHTRVSRVRVTTVKKAPKAPFPEKQLRSCPRCKESSNSMKILTARVSRIEELVNTLAATTRGLASMAKRDDRFTQNNLKFKRLDLTRCSLQDLQKLVVATTNIMAPNLKKSESVADGSDAGTTTNTDETITEEPMSMEDVKATNSEELSSHNNQPPETSSIRELKCTNAKRQDSGFAEVEPRKPIHKVTQLSDKASDLNR